MNYVKLYARAKINPALNVIKKLDNGYHSIETIMQSINLVDTIRIEKTDVDNIILTTNLLWLPTDRRNLVYKTAQLLKQTYNIKEGIKINLFKRIPISAGLAGGSTDCAAALIGIRNLFKLPISNEELFNISKSLGADVPFCLMRGTALAKGIGEKLTPLPPFPPCYILIVKPPVSVSTSSVFENLSLENIKARPDIEKIIYCLKTQNLIELCNNMCNVLETVTIKRHPIIEKIKDIMVKKGAMGSLMSGSGSSVFGIFLSKKSAVFASKEIQSKYNIKDIFITKPFNNY